MEWSRQNASESGGSFEITNDIEKAYTGAHVIYPRSWMSAECAAVGIDKLGTEKEAQLHEKYRDWICDAEKMALASKDAIYMHCLPVFRGEEATDEVVDSKQSVVFDQAENRLHLQKGLLSLVMSDENLQE
jgi:N-acetylornithine carbamoyltransferase